MNNENIVQLAINTIRTLSIDAVQQAKSGHPGAPMALAPLIYTIWNGCCGTTRRTPFGLIATGSSFQTDTPRCCSGQLFTWLGFWQWMSLTNVYVNWR